MSMKTSLYKYAMLTSGAISIDELTILKFCWSSECRASESSDSGDRSESSHFGIVGKDSM